MTHIERVVIVIPIDNIYANEDGFPDMTRIEELRISIRYKIDGKLGEPSYIKLTKDNKWDNRVYIRFVSEKDPCPNLREKLVLTNWDDNDPYLEEVNPTVTDYIVLHLGFVTTYGAVRFLQHLIHLGGMQFQPSNGAKLVEDLFVDPILSKWRRGVHTFVKLQESGQTLKSAAKRY